MRPSRGDGLGLVETDLAVAPGLGALGQVSQGTPEAHTPPGGCARQATSRGDPCRRRLGTVCRPFILGLEGGARFGDKGLEARQEPVQLLDGRGVAVVGRSGGDERLERFAESFQLQRDRASTAL